VGGDDHDLAVLDGRLERLDDLVAADVGELLRLIDYLPQRSRCIRMSSVTISSGKRDD
jgi:hypothetical protein